VAQATRERSRQCSCPPRYVMAAFPYGCHVVAGRDDLGAVNVIREK
jgi:hypothetical protein